MADFPHHVPISSNGPRPERAATRPARYSAKPSASGMNPRAARACASRTGSIASWNRDSMVVDEDRAAWRGSVRSGGPRRRLAPASARCSDRPIPGPDDPLRICFLVYRGNPHCGGQGVYTRHLTRELARLGHDVEVLAGPPYPVVDEPVRLTRLRGIDFYGGPEPMSRTAFLDVRTGIDLLEYLMVCTAAFPEPLCFSLRAWRHLIRRPGEFDIVHDNQCLAWGLLGIERHPGIPVVATLHHPVTVDRELELRFAPDLRRQVSLRRFYSFL